LNPESRIARNTIEAVQAAVGVRMDRASIRPVQDAYQQALVSLFQDQDPVLDGLEPDALGGVYEALLQVRPVQIDGRLEFEKDPANRRRTGTFFTPRAIADLAIEEVLTPSLKRGADPKDLRIVDPAAGGGAFLLAAARRLGGRLAGLVGVDRDPGAVAVSYLALVRAFPRGGKPGLHVGDALLDPPKALWKPASFDAVLGNPPFLNVKRGALRPDHDALRARFQTARGQYDAWALFLELALDLLKPGGRYALVLPRPFLASESYERIRRTILTRGSLERVVDLGTPFPGAHVEAMVVVGMVGITGTRPRPLRFLDLTRSPPASRSGPASTDFLDLPHAAISIECGREDMAFLRAMGRAPQRLGTVVHIARGLECGKRHPAVLAAPGPGRTPCLLGDQVDAFCTAPPAYLALDRLPEKKRKSSRLFHPRPKLLIRRVAPTLKVAVDETGAFTLNTLYVLRAREPDTPDDFYYILSALLNSTLVRRYHRLAFAARDRLFPYIRISQLARLPLPSLTRLRGRAGARLAALARKAHAEKDFQDRSELDNLVRRIYFQTTCCNPRQLDVQSSK